MNNKIDKNATPYVLEIRMGDGSISYVAGLVVKTYVFYGLIPRKRKYRLIERTKVIEPKSNNVFKIASQLELSSERLRYHKFTSQESAAAALQYAITNELIDLNPRKVVSEKRVL